ncbi:MAG: hypothetical protein ACR2MX_09335 [Cyclobacteriaceae bacterium]
MTYTNRQTYLDRINLVYYALISVPLLLFAIVYLNYYRDKLLIPMDRTIAWWYIVIAIGCVVLAGIGYHQYRKKLKRLFGEQSLRDKLDQWHQALSGNFWLMGSLSSVAVVAFYTSKSQVFVACYALLLFLVSLLRPTQQRLIRELKLKSEHLKVIEKNEEIPF